MKTHENKFDIVDVENFCSFESRYRLAQVLLSPDVEQARCLLLITKTVIITETIVQTICNTPSPFEDSGKLFFDS
jgi:hypothetical protein